eukprot:SAG11_NODE_1738_length_4341_cov_3.274806_4_plen_147_part_00
MPLASVTHKLSQDGLSWSASAYLNMISAGPNSTWGGSGLASGIALTRGPHAGRLVVALRGHGGSFAIYSDDSAATWHDGETLLLFGKCWTECEVAELRNGSVLMSSRNFCGLSSGYGPRLFARSDDGPHLPPSRSSAPWLSCSILP